MVEPEHSGLSMARKCELLVISRSGRYYKATGESAENLALMRLMDEAYLECPYYGARQMRRHLQRLGHKMPGHNAGRHRVARLMRKMGLAAIYQKPNTSRPNPENRIYPYLLRGLAITKLHQVWCTDITYISITYISMRKGFLYLVVVMDWHSRRVLSWTYVATIEYTEIHDLGPQSKDASDFWGHS